MLKNVPFLAAANEIAVASHERYDGSGFPRGLKGEAIPIGGRIIAVADVWDELVSASAIRLSRPLTPSKSCPSIAWCSSIRSSSAR